jgi:acyl-CoA synthetase (NDP forming)
VLLYLETFGNPRKFTRIARAMSRTKPIVAVKTGGTLPNERVTAGGRPAAARPAEATTDALLAQSGVIRVETPPELFAVARVLLCQPVPKGARVAVVSNSNGATRLAEDACARAGLDVTRTFAMTWTAQPADYERAVGDALQDEAVDSIVMVYAPPIRERRAEVGHAVVRATDRHAATGGRGKPIVSTILGEAAMTSFRGESGTALPLFEFPGDAARVLGLITDYGEWRARPEGQPVDLEPDLVASVRDAVAAVLDRDADGRWLDRDEMADLLGLAGFAVASHRTVGTVDDAVAAADDLEFPVVLKATGIERVHPGEEGGVALDLHDEHQLRAAYERMSARLGDAMRPAVVQTMVPPGADVLVAAHQHASFGGTVSVGIGGAMAAANPDLPTRILPLTDADADRLVASSPVATPLALEGEGAGATLSAFLARLGAVLEHVPEIADVVMSPLIVRHDRADVVDAWIRIAPYDWNPIPDVRRLD